MKAKELREKTNEALEQMLKECRDNIVNFRFQLATGVVENVRRAREARKDIARIKTIIKEREMAEAKRTTES
ncbi:MAG TPA: 50S ribosomal protein L29 [Candidatus Hydrogenedentes bacterium]|nr:MAG: 50S ribosomal protein L29 [Candidatus Hydrogenedentes bacterium ADurb.Bin170]HNZ49244.1 50S ribosomal protein L29 [Candidatus Hydrogenedentota bacterium]HOD95652.1 50S ribosomal protein L29 [Candidatus Hydrogenedentota bacterium]HOH31102.1 50S ribosomal protein L29 [Candidatus Hydrogenedentota bacterium]HOM47128.1 50S ribosomal protein L29 [Candidatus Hydrogenedentota bacterium]